MLTKPLLLCELEYNILFDNKNNRRKNEKEGEKLYL
jgi:hypothetical protein